jgi:hypothetical protein
LWARANGWPLWARIAVPTGILFLLVGLVGLVGLGDRSKKSTADASSVSPVDPAIAGVPTSLDASMTTPTGASDATVPAAAVTATTVPPATGSVRRRAPCTTEGATGYSKAGVPMICASTNKNGAPNKDGRLRWRSK